jgi:hypothetical protein
MNAMISLKRYTWGVLALSAALVPRGALAQTAAPPRAFVEGSLLASVDQVLKFEDDPHFSADASWTFAAGGSIGVFLTPAWTLRAEFEVPRHAGSDIEARGHTYYLSATGPGIEYRFVTARRDTTIAGLLGVQLRSSGRVRPSLLFRGGLSHMAARRSIQLQDPPGSPWSNVKVRNEVKTWTENNPTLNLGLDVEILMTKTFALVPRVRASIVMGETSATILRPGVAARWRF